MLSFRSQLVVVALIFCLLPVGVYFYLGYAANEYRRDKIEFLDIATETSQKQIESWLQDREKEIKLFSRLEPVMRQDKEWMQNNFKNLIAGHENFAELVFVNSQGITEVDTLAEPGMYLGDREYFVAGKQCRSYVSDILIGRASGKPLIVVSAPVFDDAGGFKGVIFGTVKLEQILAQLGKFNYGDAYRLYIVTREGYVFGNTRLDSSGLAVDRQLADKIFLAIGQSSETYNASERDKVYEVYQVVPNRNWAVVGEIDKKELFKVIDRLSRESKYMVMGMLLFSLLSAIFLSRYSARPLEKLRRSLEQMAKGDYGQPVGLENNIAVPLEIRLAVDAFDKMSSIMAEKDELWQRYKLLSENTSDIIMFLDAADGRILEANRAATEAYGYSMSELLNLTIRDIRAESTLSDLREKMNTAWVSGVRFETLHVRKGGHIFPVEVSSRGAVVGGRKVLMSIIRDITERKRYEDELTKLSLYDKLTGLFNRNFFESEIGRLTLENSAGTAIIMADVDGLKVVNDNLGHSAGDALLIAAAKALKSGVRSGDFAARIGGDEFAVILKENITAEAVEQIIARIKKAADEHNLTNHKLPLYLSLGYAVIQTGENVEQAIVRADNAMYAEKNGNRERVYREINKIISAQQMGKD